MLDRNLLVAFGAVLTWEWCVRTETSPRRPVRRPSSLSPANILTPTKMFTQNIYQFTYFVLITECIVSIFTHSFSTHDHTIISFFSLLFVIVNQTLSVHLGQADIFTRSHAGSTSQPSEVRTQEESAHRLVPETVTHCTAAPLCCLWTNRGIKPLFQLNSSTSKSSQSDYI